MQTRPRKKKFHTVSVLGVFGKTLQTTALHPAPMGKSIEAAS